jgi:hypothetical protein
VRLANKTASRTQTSHGTVRDEGAPSLVFTGNLGVKQEEQPFALFELSSFGGM